VDCLPNVELLLLVRLAVGEPRFSRRLSQRHAVEGGILILGRRATVPIPTLFDLLSNASKNRVRVIVFHSCLLRVVRGVDRAILWYFRRVRVVVLRLCSLAQSIPAPSVVHELCPSGRQFHRLKQN
jgi:hypothetical protein